MSFLTVRAVLSVMDPHDVGGCIGYNKEGATSITRYSFNLVFKNFPFLNYLHCALARLHRINNSSTLIFIFCLLYCNEGIATDIDFSCLFEHFIVSYFEITLAEIW